MMSLALSDGLMAIVGGTMFSISSFAHEWPFGDTGEYNSQLTAVEIFHNHISTSLSF